MESILLKLTLPDNASIREGTSQLREALRSPSAVAELCGALASSGEPQVRQYAAVLLRRRLSRPAAWRRLSAGGGAEAIKAGCLAALVAEADGAVKMAIAQLVAAMARHEVARGGAKVSWDILTERNAVKCFQAEFEDV